MSDRNKPHNGRDKSGHFKVKQEDVDELTSDPQGEEFLRDDVRLGGAVADNGPHAGEHGTHIGDLIESNREDVNKFADNDRNTGNR